MPEELRICRYVKLMLAKTALFIALVGPL